MKWGIGETFKGKKRKRIGLMRSEGTLAGEMKHGPPALVDEKLPLSVTPL